MKIMLVDMNTGAERGWIEFRGTTFRICCQLEMQNIGTLLAFCGIRILPQHPPERIEFE